MTLSKNQKRNKRKQEKIESKAKLRAKHEEENKKLPGYSLPKVKIAGTGTFTPPPEINDGNSVQ